MDSFMYQTVGHQAIEAYARCMELPLYRQEIAGSAVRQEMEYVRTPDDEVEDLFVLLQRVKVALPHVTAVSSGAILSNYQRLRVENVYEILLIHETPSLYQLTSRLRGRNQEELLQEMIDRQLHAVVIKVAAMGLLPNKHLGRSLQQLQPHLLSLAAKYGCNVCGEGGEYETFTLDCPLFKRKIVLDHTEVFIHSDDAFAPVGLLQLLEYSTEDKTEEKTGWTEGEEYHKTEGVTPGRDVIRVAGTKRIDIESVASKFSTAVPGKRDADHGYMVDGGGKGGGPLSAPAAQVCVKQSSSSFSCVGYVQSDETARDQLERLLCTISEELRERKLTMADISFVSLYVSEMSEFGTLNDVYNRYFELCPPSRACVEVSLQSDTRVLLHAMGLITPTKLPQRLHVQSISHWAPACIGPYAQAVKLDNLVLLAGQIGLDPPTMKLLPSALLQAKQARRSVSQVIDVVSPSRSLVVAACVYVSRAAGMGSHEDVVNEAECAWEDGQLTLKEDMLLRCYIGVDNLPRNAALEYQVWLPFSSRNRPPWALEKVIHTFLILAMVGAEDDFRTSRFEAEGARAVSIWHGRTVIVQAHVLSAEPSCRKQAVELLKAALRAAGFSLERDVCSVTLFQLPSFDTDGVHLGDVPIAHVPTHLITAWNSISGCLEPAVALYSITCMQ